MSGYTLGNNSFVRWDGPRPGLAKQHVREFVRTGVNGTSVQLLGEHGDPFSVQLTSVFPYAPDVLVAESAYRKMVGGIFTLRYEGVSYARLYGTRYLVREHTPLEAKRLALLIGPDYHYQGGWRVVSQFTLIPMYTAK